MIQYRSILQKQTGVCIKRLIWHMHQTTQKQWQHLNIRDITKHSLFKNDFILPDLLNVELSEIGRSESKSYFHIALKQ